MSFWSASKTRRRVPSPDTEDMFFDTASNFPRSNLAERLGSSVFDDFPTSRRSAAAMRNFPSHAADPMPFGGSLPRHQRHHAPSWLSSEDFVDSRESSPLSDAAQRIPRHPTFQRTDSNPSRATPPASRQDSRHGSRSSTPESTGSGHSHRSRTSTGTDDGGGHADETMEEHPGVTARNGRPSFTARRQPKVHHIPITVEPRDGSSTPVVLTPPVDNTANDISSSYHHNQQQKAPSESPPVTRCSSQTTPEDGNAFPSSSPQSGTPQSTNQTKTVPSPPATATAKKPPFRAKAKAPSAPGGGPTKPVVPEPVFPTATPKPAAAPEPEPPKPAAPRRTPLDAVNEVLEDVARLREVVAQFAGAKGDKHYLYLDEMLTRNLIRLDNISTEGNDDVRQARRGAVLAINDCLALLDSQAALSVSAEAMASEAAANPAATEEMQGVVQDATTTDDKVTAAAEVKEETSGDTMQPEQDGVTNSTMDVECTISASGAEETNASEAAVDVAAMDTDDGASLVGPEGVPAAQTDDVPAAEAAEKSEDVVTVEAVN